MLLIPNVLSETRCRMYDDYGSSCAQEYTPSRHTGRTAESTIRKYQRPLASTRGKVEPFCAKATDAMPTNRPHRGKRCRVETENLWPFASPMAWLLYVSLAHNYHTVARAHAHRTYIQYTEGNDSLFLGLAHTPVIAPWNCCQSYS